MAVGYSKIKQLIQLNCQQKCGSECLWKRCLHSQGKNYLNDHNFMARNVSVCFLPSSPLNIFLRSRKPRATDPTRASTKAAAQDIIDFNCGGFLYRFCLPPSQTSNLAPLIQYYYPNSHLQPTKFPCGKN